MVNIREIRRTLGAAAWALAVVVAPAPVRAENGDPMRYVALGDSFTAGPFIPDQNQQPGGCLRSDHNAPHLLAADLGLDLVDVSCSGATTADMTNPQDLRGDDNPPQLDALGPETDVVTVIIGSNDTEWFRVALGCISLTPLGSPCKDKFVTWRGDELSERIAAVAPLLGGVLGEIHARAPQADVFVGSYLPLLPDSGVGCWPTIPLARGDVPYLRDKIREFNAMSAGVAAQHDAIFVDVYTPGIGHDACQPPAQRWMEPLIPASPAAPLHPNAVGMVGVAEVFRAALEAA